MAQVTNLLKKVSNRIARFCLQPIPIFVFHQVSDFFYSDTMLKCDWTQTEQFKKNINILKEKYTFISLPAAVEHLRCDYFRRKNYAVLTCDDGWASIKDIIPWLVKEKINLTLFLNPQYLDGFHFRESPSDRFLTKEDINYLLKMFPNNIYIGSHGWNHQDTTQYSKDEFLKSVIDSESELSKFSNKIPYYAFTYGKYNESSIEDLKINHLFPVFVDGKNNIKYENGIHRQCIDGIQL